MTRRSGFRKDYHPTPADLDNLRVLDKKKRNYITSDGRVFSNRAVTEARQGYISLEQARELRKIGWTRELLSYKERGLPISIPLFAERWEKRNNYMSGSGLFSKQFRKDFAKAIKKIKKAEEDLDYDSAERFLDDNFGMDYEEINFYAKNG